MWQQTQSFCLVLSVIITGSLSVPWSMAVSPVVFVPRGQDAVLSCSFTHPRQQHYSGTITVKWLARESKAPPFFRCTVKNDSVGGINDCGASGLKYSLEGDPRWGELSLLIRKVHLEDNGTYFCRVELQGLWKQDQKETQLYVTAEPQISSLSVVETSSDGAPRRLQCEAEGHPLPTVSWLSASGAALGDQVQTSMVGSYRLVSSVPYLEGEVLSCRVENRLGAAERRYPASNTLKITLTVCGLIVMLLLLTGLVFYMRSRARVESPPVYENTATVGANPSAIYGNADEVENHRLQSSDCPAEGDVELQLVYSALSLPGSTSSQHARFKSQQEETDIAAGVLYSPLNVKQ
ncbi:sialic acid binding Ig-like lectin 15, like [Anoplopoma fimbria]|uniref:sialic acid binding Ig-like lectin 15, like n=1 Tax=Anoplopoma fimbria TaxID=229290 RepID=UPI0023EC25EA|nr:sialic acid binding Ig-like lectin 15, like [Anoplopoma fimbria]